MVIADIVRQKIRESGKSINRICEETGITYPTLHRLMHMRGGLTAQTLEKFLTWAKMEIRPIDSKEV